ncbi:hypothetical protein GWI33_008560 [Rhynchophorus ferrugineus]|uniref:Mitochondrial import inner membrane translocase subunit Tim21 n=1 Tax=Rhynchophorus ferrugineus TaxID=354439 RepID=A0A834ICE7_RHYFE|nr:hypothetical protein GWI33_008560 [Rhynchophorus ferrugineus]
MLALRLKSTKRNELTPSNINSNTSLDTNVRPFKEKVKESAKLSYNTGIVICGFGLVCAIMYTVISELCFSDRPNMIYNKAVKKCTNYPQVEDKLGHPITAYGEETRRGRRQHVSHITYLDKEGKSHIRMKFYLKGSVFRGTAHLDMVKNYFGIYEYRYLFVEVDDMFKSVIIIEDNRNQQIVTELDPQL